MSGAGGGFVEGLIENPKSGSVAEYTNKSLRLAALGPVHTLQWGHYFYTTQASLSRDDRTWLKLHVCMISSL